MTEPILIDQWVGGDSTVGFEIHANDKSTFFAFVFEKIKLK